MFFIALLILATLTSYLAIGATVARSHYALAYRKWEIAFDKWQEGPELVIESREAKKARLTRELKMIDHKSYCYLNYSSLSKQGCSCESRVQWHSKSHDIQFVKDTLAARPREPEVQLKPVLTWPVVKMQDYIKSGEVKGYDPQYTRILEQKAGINELMEIR